MQQWKLVLCLALATVVWGCGGGGSSTPGTGGTNPPPSGSPPPGNGGAQWTSNLTGATGTVTVSSGGDVSIQVSKAPPSTSFVGNFCQWPGSDYFTRGLDPCFLLNQTLSTDASGTGQLTFHFPKSGPWAGTFNFARGGDTNSPQRITSDNVGTSGMLTAPLVPMSKMNQGRAPAGVASGTVQDAGSGTVSLSAGTVAITLKGATANATYGVSEYFSDAGSASQQIGALQPDGSGNGSVTLTVAPGSGAIFALYRNVTPQTPGFVSGFTVP